MLGTKDVMATIAVKDLSAARRFYETALGLAVRPTRERGVLMCTSGRSTVLVYESQYAGTNKATAATWVVGDDVQGVVQALKAKGVSFEHYDFPETRREGDVHIMGDVKAAWCKDPDGNILALVNG